MFQEMLQVGSGGGSTKVKKGTFKGSAIGVYTSLNCGFKPKYISVYSVGNNSASYKDTAGISIYNDGEIINSFVQARSGKLVYNNNTSVVSFEITNDGFKYSQNYTGSFENMDMEFLAIG